MAVKKTISILLMTVSDENTATIQRAFSSYRIVFLKSKPSYANYLKILQYLPDAIIMEMPQPFHDELHFIQLVKQNRTAGNIPIICFGDTMPADTVSGMLKIGINVYLGRPFDNKTLAEAITGQIRKLGITLNQKTSGTEDEKQFDMEQILSPETPFRRKVDLMAKHVTETRAFPFTVSMALRLLNSDKSSAADLAKIIETDPTLSASFLKKANSVFFAGKNSRPISMKDAIVRIGFTETRRIITGMAVMQLFDAQKMTPGFNRMKFWTHCLATAKIAEKLALLTRHANADEAFLAGIMHDFGIILFDEFFPSLFSRILQVSTDFGIRFVEAEQEILTITHNDLVRRMFNQWDMPEQISDAVVNHSTVLQSSFDPDAPENLLTLIIATANILAKTFRLGASCDQFVAPLDNALFSTLQLTTGLPDGFYRDIAENLQTYKRLLKIEEERLPDRGTMVSLHRTATGIVKLTNALFNPIENYLLLSDYTVIPINLREPPDQYHGKCEVMLIFADSTTTLQDLQSLACIRKKQVVTVPEDTGAGEGPFAPVIIFTNKQSPCFAAINNPEFSQLPESIDLRMLDMHINSVIQGKKIKVLSWETLLKPAITIREQKNEWQRKIQEMYRTLQKFKEQCSEHAIVSDDHTTAELLLARAVLRENEYDYETAYALVVLAAEYYRRSILAFELSRCEKTITEKELHLGRITVT